MFIVVFACSAIQQQIELAIKEEQLRLQQQNLIQSQAQQQSSAQVGVVKIGKNLKIRQLWFE